MANKSVSIKDASDKELDELLVRLRKEREAQSLAMDIKRNSTPPDPLRPYDYLPVFASTEVPVETLYHNEAVQNTLAHYGILGMKWGVRRAAGPDGTVGGKGERRAIKKERKLDVKNRRQLSDKDLLEKIGRLEKEKKLRELTEAEIKPGKTYTKEILKSAGSKVATTVIAGAALYAVQAALTRTFNPADMAKNMFFKK